MKEQENFAKLQKINLKEWSLKIAQFHIVLS